MATVEKLLMVGIADPDPTIREAVFKQLSRIETSPAMIHYLGMREGTAPLGRENRRGWILILFG
jgi:hypothetical protein